MSIKGLFPIDKWDFKSESVLADLPAEDFDLLTAHQTEQVYKKGEIIFREGAYPAGIFYIKAGKVKKYKLDKEGKEHIIYVANKEELLGYHAILSEDRYPDSAASIEESRIAFIPKEDFLAVLNQSPVLNRRLLKTLSHEFAVLANSLSMFAQKNVRERLALQLIVLREKYKVNFKPGMPVEINMSRDDLANLVGTGRENVVRVLTEFKESGILKTQGRKIIINDVNQLIIIADYK
ncbi:MAG: transcriptional regulator, Crp/Fnr family [Ferruginibacter sp.]|jgi:CRP-like cAMP-binding protein|uniref:Crp/Fnr family transcriptional regulator n=1 Tax=Ferruginibacter sp. TaxID=1940288 RepID=UPI002657FEAC|nr:Crp/Fnr family transcriptional regulator [Ferruginibacter sp.]MDB5279111.1 transcriptional regulator, Crp/Fnr family [Ferruginibacter sp.]